MTRLSPKLEALCDAEKSFYKSSGGGQWVTHKTLTVGRAKAICEAGREATGLIGTSIVNKGMSKQQAYDILSKFDPETKDDEPIHFLAAKYILREFGKYYKQAT